MNSKDFGFCYRVAFESIGKENGIGRMICEIAKRIGATVVVTNIYGEIVSECDILNLRQEKESYVKELRNLILPDPVNPECNIQCGFSDGMVMKSIEVKHNVEGFAVIFFQDLEEKEDCMEIVKIIVKAVAIELEHHKDRAWCSISMERQIVSEIVLGGKSEPGDGGYIKDKMEQRYLIPGFLLGIVWVDGNHRGILQSIRNQIYERDRNLLSYLSDEKLYLLFTGRKDAESTVEILEEISEGFQVRICVGDLFSDKSEILNRKQFLERSARTGAQLYPCRNFFEEKEYYLEAICSYMMEEIGFKGYYCEELERLKKEDCQKGTEFYGSLKQYLLSGNNVSMAAKKLFVHRNTMIYRLQKINELLKINLNEPDTARMLLISMILQELIDKNDKKVDEDKDLR